MWFLKNVLNDGFINLKQKLKLGTGLMSKFILESYDFTRN
jgi:hypothetical protein